MKEKIRNAGIEDIPFISWVMLNASRSGKEKGFWDYFLSMEEKETLWFISELSVLPFNSICHYSVFQVLEFNQKPAAAMACFFPEEVPSTHFRKALDCLWNKNQWSPQAREDAWQRVSSHFSCFHPFQPETWIIEWVAVSPEFRGKDLALKLLSHCLNLGQKKGAEKFQIQVAKNNFPAQKTYLKAGFQIKKETTSAQFFKDYGYEGILNLTLDKKPQSVYLQENLSDLEM